MDEQLKAQVKGFLDPAEGRCLYETAQKAARIGPCLEIGSYCGKSTLYLGAACKEEGGILFSVDHHRGSEEQQPGEAYFDPALFDPHTFCVDTFKTFKETIESAGLLNTVVPVVCTSKTAARAWTTPLGLVFIDGGHSHAAVLEDYTLWAPHVTLGGYLLFHDIFEDPTQGGQAPFNVYSRALASGHFELFVRVKTLGVLKRKKTVSQL